MNRRSLLKMLAGLPLVSITPLTVLAGKKESAGIVENDGWFCQADFYPDGPGWEIEGKGHLFPPVGNMTVEQEDGKESCWTVQYACNNSPLKMGDLLENPEVECLVTFNDCKIKHYKGGITVLKNVGVRFHNCVLEDFYVVPKKAIIEFEKCTFNYNHPRNDPFVKLRMDMVSFEDCFFNFKNDWIIGKEPNITRLNKEILNG